MRDNVRGRGEVKREDELSADARPDPEKVDWDVIIVGTGMGGGTLGYELARGGHRVLFLEKGYARLGPGTTAANPSLGRLPEEAWDLAQKSEAEYSKRLLVGGRYPALAEDVTEGGAGTFIPHIGCGTGGSSALYGMVLERFYPSDFAPGRAHDGITDSTLPEQWPISYEELAPWYAKAEHLFQVHGSADPCRPGAEDGLLPPAQLTPANQEIFDSLKARGMHPYHLHMGCASLPECSTCQSYLCPRPCKSEAGRTCVTPAVVQYGATLLSECSVMRLEAGRTQVQKVVCRWQGRTIAVQGKIVVLAAGALSTPGILLNSTSVDWPNGVANASDMVGRNLMRHLLDFYLIAPRTKGPIGGQIKEIGFNDLYDCGGRKYGNVQSFGPFPPMAYLLNRPEAGLRRKVVRLTRPFVSRPWDWFRSRRMALVSIMEDLPYRENRVLPSVGADGVVRIKFQYTIQAYERRRQAEFRAAMAGILTDSTYLRLKGEANSYLGHVCGTCRFGTDRTTSILDGTNRAHDLSNLYVCDASFFPSSAGINPALTVAANAMRVAAHLQSRL